MSEEIQSRYGYTEVLDNDFSEYGEEDKLYNKLMALFDEFHDNEATQWITAKWKRNQSIFLCQGLGIPLAKTIDSKSFNPLDIASSSGERKPLTSTPILYSTYENLKSDAIEMQPEAIFLGRTADDGKMASDMTEIFRCFLQRRNWKAKYEEWVSVRSRYGLAWIETVWDDTLDHNKGDADIRVWNPLDIFVDPLYEDIQDGRAIFKVTHHHPSWYKEHYPDAYMKMNNVDRDFEDDNVIISNTEKQSETIPLYECWCRRYNAKSQRYEVHMYKLSGGVVLENSELNKETKNGMYSHGEYPFVGSYYEKIEGTPWALGPLDYLAPVQRYISDMDDYILQNIKASARPRKYYKDGFVDPKKLADMDYEVVPVQTGGGSITDAIQWEIPQPLNTVALQMYASKTETLKTESGQNSASRGEVPGSVTAASAIQLLQSAGSKRANLSQYNLNNAFSCVVRQTVSNMMQGYTEERIFRLKGNLIEGDQAFVWNPEIYTEDWEYDLDVRIQRESTFMTAYTNQTILSLMQMGAIDSADAVQLLDIPNHDVVQFAVEKNNKIKQTITSLMNEVQQLRDQVGAAAEENAALTQAAEQAVAMPDNVSFEGNPTFAQ